MKYNNLTIHQKISLKGEFERNPIMENYKIIMFLWNFRIAIDYFLTDDISLLYSRIEDEIYNIY